MKIFKIIFLGLFLYCFLFGILYPQVKPYDEILAQAYSSDIIIIGEVKSIMDMPAPSSEMFHSMIQIQIDSLIKGKINYQEIIIRQEGGPITDGIHGGTRIKWSDEPELVIDQHYVFFLKKPENSPYLNSPFVKKKYKSFNNKKSINELSNNTFWIDNRHVFKIVNSKVSYFDTTINKIDFIKIIEVLK